jgi:hypothetical protein
MAKCKMHRRYVLFGNYGWQKKEDAIQTAKTKIQRFKARANTSHVVLYSSDRGVKVMPPETKHDSCALNMG